MTGLLENKSILVTWCHRGIGAVAAEAISAEGAYVTATDVFPEDDSRIPDLLGRLGNGDAYVQAEITSTDLVAGLIKGIVETREVLDGAANVAGIVGLSYYTADFPEDEWLKVVSVNVHGTWLWMKHEIDQMLKQGGGGAIVNIASIASHSGEVLRSPYVGPKAGVLGLTKTAGIEYAKQGIRINAVLPGPIETPQYRVDNGGPGSAKYDAVAKFQPIGRLGQDAEIADAVIWLLSDRATFVVGQEIVVDGGVVAEGVTAALVSALDDQLPVSDTVQRGVRRDCRALRPKAYYAACGAEEQERGGDDEGDAHGVDVAGGEDRVDGVLQLRAEWFWRGGWEAGTAGLSASDREAGLVEVREAVQERRTG